MFSFLADYVDAFNKLVEGIPVTIFLTVAGLCVSFIFASTATLIKVVGGYFANKIVDIYVLVFTGTPLLFQYFIFYYSPPQFEIIQDTWIMDLFNNTTIVAILVIGLNSGAYSTVIFHGGIKGIDAGQWQVSQSMGLSKWQTFRLLYPYALRRVLPTYSNEVILLFKGTALVSMITVVDVFDLARQYYGETYDAITPFVTAGVIYLFISLIFTIILRIIERRWMTYAI